MINGTGMIETDELILEIVNKTNNQKNKMFIVEKYFKKYECPKRFFKFVNPFLTPNFSLSKKFE